MPCIKTGRVGAPIPNCRFHRHIYGGLIFREQSAESNGCARIRSQHLYNLVPVVKPRDDTK